MSFYCPHFDEPDDGCRRIRCVCVPGRRGCVLRGKATFLVDPEARVAERLRERQAADDRRTDPDAGNAAKPYK